MDEEQMKQTVDSLRDRRESVSARLSEYGLREPETLSDEEATAINRLIEDDERLHADD